MPGFEVFSHEERKEVQDVLDTGVLFRYGFDAARKGHWKAKTFEQELAKRLNVKYCHMVSSGTTALITALAACGVGAGDEVIVPSFTFVATFEAVLAMGAVPVYADIDDTLCLDPRAVARAVTPRTKAVMPVHMCGSMARIDELERVCREKGLILIEDTCQAVGGTFFGRALGTFGAMGCFSFDPVKTITAGEGGAVITQDENLYRIADQFADHGHDHAGNDRGLEDHPIMGLNFRISELNAAVAVAQLRKLDFILEKQRANKKIIKDALSGYKNISFRHIPDPAGDTATFLCWLMPDEAAAREAVAGIAKVGLSGCPYWYANKWHYFKSWEHLHNLKAASRLPIELCEKLPNYKNLDLTASDSIMSRTLTMQIMVNWTEADLADRIGKLDKVFGG
jgi:8-amino-3,8-dideoxy-alpha-D-manno-octulosonate transaminase